MPEQQQIPSLHSKNFQTKGKTYYFNVREAKNGNQYLTITETYTKDGQQRYSSLNIFGNNLEGFAAVFSEMAEKVKS